MTDYPITQGTQWQSSVEGELWTVDSNDLVLVVPPLAVDSFTVRQESPSLYVLKWKLTAPNTESVRLSQVLPIPAVVVADFPASSTATVVESVEPAGTLLSWELFGLTSFGIADVSITVQDLDTPFTYAPVDYTYPGDGIPRYTTLEQVKAALNIQDTVNDAELTQAINAAELQIDVFNEQAFPSTGLNPWIPVVPTAISLWALSASIGTYKLRDQVFGSAGSDDWLGSVDVGEQVRRSLQRNPLARGYRHAWGIA